MWTLCLGGYGREIAARPICVFQIRKRFYYIIISISSLYIYFLMQPTYTEKVHHQIRAAKPKKAPGLDGITNSALKMLPGKVVVVPVSITNSVLRLRYFPR